MQTKGIIFIMCAGFLGACSARTGTEGNDASASAGESADVTTAAELRFDSLGRELSAVTRRIVVLNEESGAPEPLARVEVQPDEIVEFYETDGGLLVSGAGAPRGNMVLGSEDRVDARRLWSIISDGTPPPEALATAFDREDQRLATAVTSPSEVELASGNELVTPTAWAEPLTSEAYQARKVASQQRADEAAQVRQAVSGGWCDTTYYTYAVGQPYNNVLGACLHWNFNVCWDNVTGFGSATDKVSLMRTNVCAAQGSLLYTVSGAGSWSVPEDSTRYAWFDDPSCGGLLVHGCKKKTASVDNATGTRYHFRFHVVH
jgi:hypothetical protein